MGIAHTSHLSRSTKNGYLRFFIYIVFVFNTEQALCFLEVSQVTNEDDQSIEAQVVAALRFPNLEALQTTQKLISEAIEQIQKQEK